MSRLRGQNWMNAKPRNDTRTGTATIATMASSCSRFERDKCIIVFAASSYASRQRWWRRWWWSQLLLEPNGRQMFLSFFLSSCVHSFLESYFPRFPSCVLLCHSHSISRNRSASDLTCSCLLACMFIQFIFMLQRLVLFGSSILSLLYI